MQADGSDGQTLQAQLGDAQQSLPLRKRYSPMPDKLASGSELSYRSQAPGTSVKDAIKHDYNMFIIKIL